MAERAAKLKAMMAISVAAVVILALLLLGGNGVSFSVEYETANDNNYWPWLPEYAATDQETALLIPDAGTWNLSFSQPVFFNQSHWRPDFANYSYALLDWRDRPSSGYYIDFVNVTYNSGVMEFRYTRTSPGPGDNVLTVITHPRSFIQIPKDQFGDYPVRDYRFILM